jgi:hypothetical protein
MSSEAHPVMAGLLEVDLENRILHSLYDETLRNCHITVKQICHRIESEQRETERTVMRLFRQNLVMEWSNPETHITTYSLTKDGLLLLKRGIECCYCGKMCADEETLYRHVRRHHPGRQVAIPKRKQTALTVPSIPKDNVANEVLGRPRGRTEVLLARICNAQGKVYAEQTRLENSCCHEFRRLWGLSEAGLRLTMDDDKSLKLINAPGRGFGHLAGMRFCPFCGLELILKAEELGPVLPDEVS